MAVICLNDLRNLSIFPGFSKIWNILLNLIHIELLIEIQNNRKILTFFIFEINS